MVLGKALLGNSIARPPNLVFILLGGRSPTSMHSRVGWYIQTDQASILIEPVFLRNEEAANRIISELKSFQPDGELTFIKKDLTLLQSVDEVCEEIRAKEKKLNLLFMSQGTMSLKGRDGNWLPPHPALLEIVEHLLNLAPNV